MAGRADRIASILKDNDGRMKVGKITEQLRKVEKLDRNGLAATIVPATVRQDNRTRLNRGESVRFNIFGSGTEEHGFISLKQPKNNDIPDMPRTGLSNPDLSSHIVKSNDKVRSELATEIQNLTWQEFERNLLPLVLEALGFTDVTVTQLTRDGGIDAVCEYTRGLNRSQAIVSAKHWGKNTISVRDIREMRGINNVADMAIIITTAKFSKPAIREAGPTPNQRSVILIDSNAIINACLEKRLGVEEVELPPLFRYVSILGTKDFNAANGETDVKTHKSLKGQR